MYNLLVDPVIRVARGTGAYAGLSLPDLYAALNTDTVESFQALRPHQRHAWHALLCQLGALACLRAGVQAPPLDAAGWHEALRALTPNFPEDEPWHLISPPDKPAFLQAVVGPTGSFKQVTTPDELDMLVTSKNHDVKGARIVVAEPDDWLFALITLQTMEGFLGAGNYGVSRMNGGFSNRPGFSISPTGAVGAHVIRDIERLLSLRETILDDYPVYDEDGLALIWLQPWDGASQLRVDRLDPYYIDICRRIRLIDRNGQISAAVAGSKAARIAFSKDAKGLTGDPWAPIETKDGEAKALTIDVRGFSYKRMSDILFGNDFKPARLQLVYEDDPQDCPFMLVARALVRGQGKTEGLHERRILISPRTAGYYRRGEVSSLAAVSTQRIKQAGQVRSALRFGLMMLFQNGPDDIRPKDPNSGKRADPFLDLFETEIDQDFFERLFAEVEVDDEAGREAIRAGWLASLKDRALAVLHAAEAGSPRSAIRHYRAIARAESAFNGSFYKAFRDPYFPKDTHHDAA